MTTERTSGKARIDIGSLLDALDALDSEAEASDSSPLSYQSNGHDGLTDIDSDSRPIFLHFLPKKGVRLLFRAKSTRSPLYNATPMRYCASSWPWSAALRSQITAASLSSGLSEVTYEDAMLHCASAWPCSAALSRPPNGGLFIGGNRRPPPGATSGPGSGSPS